MRILVGMMVIFQLLSIPMSGLDTQPQMVQIGQLEIPEAISTRAIETKWYYRTYNGIEQKRLWSITGPMSRFSTN